MKPFKRHTGRLATLDRVNVDTDHNPEAISEANRAQWLPVRLSEDQIDQLFECAAANPGYGLTFDLERQWITDEMGLRFGFDVAPFRRQCLLEGLDDIALTLQHEDKIREHEARRRM